MKAVLKFLLKTDAGQMILQALIAALVKLFKKKVLDKLPPEKKQDVDLIFDVVHEELHADVDAGNLKPTDLL
jgi:hypothetical protein